MIKSKISKKKTTSGVLSPDKQKENIEKTLNITGVGKYNTLDQAKYKSFLDSLSITELQDEAMKRGLKPIAERPFMTETLIKLFREYARQFIPVQPDGSSKIPPNKLAELMKIARAGR